MSSCHQAWVTGALGNIAHTFYLVIAIIFLKNFSPRLSSGSKGGVSGSSVSLTTPQVEHSLRKYLNIFRYI